jgi:putative addiction module component (TIGR02574 family)
MSRGLAEVTQDAIGLPQEERLTLARILLDVSDIPAQPLDEVEQAWEEEIAMRIKAIDSGSAKGRPWEDVLADINKHLGE